MVVFRRSLKRKKASDLRGGRLLSPIGMMNKRDPAAILITKASRLVSICLSKIRYQCRS